MALTEDQALKLTRGITLMPQEQQDRVKPLLEEYRNTRADAGQPLFPALLQEEEQKKQKFQTMFKSPQNVGQQFPELANRLMNSPDPELDQMQVANVEFLAAKTGIDKDTIWRDPLTFQGRYAQQVWKKPVADSKAFYAAAAADVMAEEKDALVQDDATSLALAEATTPMSKGAVDSMAKWKLKNPEATEQQSLKFMEAYNLMQGRLAGKEELIEKIYTGAKKGKAPNEDVIGEFLNMPASQRNLSIAAMFAKAKQEGDATDTNWGVQVGMSFVRTIDDMLPVKIAQEAVLGEIRSAVKGEVPAGTEIKSPEDAANWLKMTAEGFKTNLFDLNAAQSAEQVQRRKLSIVEKRLVNDAITKTQRGIQLARVVEQVSRTADPVKSALAAGLGSSVALMGTIAIPVVGPALSAVGYANSEYDKLRLSAPELDEKKAAGLSIVSGAIQSGLDKFEWSFLTGKVPSIRSLINGGTVSTLVGRGVIRAAEVTAFENAQEGLQDLTTPIVQDLVSRLSKDVPEVDWNSTMAQWYGSRADTFIGMLPLTLLGVGVASHQDIKNAGATMADNTRLQRLGLQQEDRTVVMQLVSDNKLPEAQAALQEAFANRRSFEEAQKAGADKEVLGDIETTDRLNKMMAEGVIPRITASSNGFVVEHNGKAHTTESWEEARGIAFQHIADDQKANIDEVAKLGEFFVKQNATIDGMQMEEEIVSDPEARTTDQEIEVGNITEEQARQNSITAGMKFGLSREEAINTVGKVLGSNIVTIQDLVAHSAIRLNQGSNVLTVMEEVVEGRATATILNTEAGRNETRQMIYMVEQATGEKFLNTETDNLVEAVSAIVTAEVVGARKDGSRLPAGSITRGVSASIKDNAQGRNFAAYLATWREFFKVVFQRARSIQKAKKSGKLGSDYQAFVDKLLGVNPDAAYSNQVAAKAGEMAGESMLSKAAAARMRELEDELLDVELDETTTNEEKAALREPIIKEKIQLFGGTGNPADYSLAPLKFGSNFAERRAQELENIFAGDPAKRAQFLKKAQTRLAGVMQSSYDVRQFNADMQQREMDNDAAIENIEQAAAVQIADLQSLKTSGVVQDEYESVKSLMAAKQSEMATLVADRNAQLQSATTADQKAVIESEYGAYSAAVADEFDRRIAAARTLAQQESLTALENEFVQAKQAAQNDHEFIMEETQSEKLKLKEKLRWTKEKAEMEQVYKLEKQALKLRFEGRQREAETARKTSIDKKIAAARSKLALRKERMQAKHDLAMARSLGDDKAQRLRDSTIEAFKVMDAIMLALPKEVRGSLGGMTKMASAKSDKARLSELTNKFEKLSAALERYLKDEYSSQLTKLIKANQPDMSAGEKPKSRLGPDAAHLFMAANKARKLSEAEVMAELARLDTIINDPQLTQDQRNLAQAESMVVEATGNLKSLTSAQLDSAVELMKGIAERGKFGWLINQQAKQSFLKARENALKSAVANPNTDTERTQQDEFNQSRFGFRRTWAMELSSFPEFMGYVFGRTNPAVSSIIDEERIADNRYHDAVTSMNTKLDTLFSQLAGGEVAGQKLRFDLAQRTIDGKGAGPISNMQAVQMLLMWSQPDGRRHMEGDAKSAWKYDQAWVDHVTSQMRPEAFQLANHLATEYGQEYTELNELYAERFGVNLPRHQNYAPLTLTPLEVTVDGQIIDPVTGQTMDGSVTHPSFLKNRSTSAITKPDFKDALNVFLAHRKKVEYWKAMYDVAKELEGLARRTEFTDVIRSKAGDSAANVFGKWAKVIGQGGIVDAAASMEINGMLNRMASRAAAAAILGRISTILIQGTQLGSAMAHMPMGSYAEKFTKLTTGQLTHGWGEALKSDFIKRRMAMMSPLVRQAMTSANVSKPNGLKHTIYLLGKLLGGADALATAGTYAMVYDYQMDQARGMGMSGSAMEDYARNETERIVETTAQPVRNTARSIYELNNSGNPFTRVAWAFASEARQKIALSAWAWHRRGEDPAYTARVAFMTIAINGFLTTVLKNSLKDLKGDDGEDKRWSVKNLVVSTLTNPLSGIPGYAALTDGGSLFSSGFRATGAFKRMFDGEEQDWMDVLRDVELLLQAAALTNENAAALSALSHLGVDAAKFLDNFLNNQ